MIHLHYILTNLINYQYYIKKLLKYREKGTFYYTLEIMCALSVYNILPINSQLNISFSTYLLKTKIKENENIQNVIQSEFPCVLPALALARGAVFVFLGGAAPK